MEHNASNAKTIEREQLIDSIPERGSSWMRALTTGSRIATSLRGRAGIWWHSIHQERWMRMAIEATPRWCNAWLSRNAWSYLCPPLPSSFSCAPGSEFNTARHCCSKPVLMETSVPPWNFFSADYSMNRCARMLSSWGNSIYIDTNHDSNMNFDSTPGRSP